VRGRVRRSSPIQALLARAGARPHDRRDRGVFGPAAGSGCWARRPTPSCAPRASGAICADGRTSSATSRSPTADGELGALLARTAGRILITLPVVAVVRAAAFSAYTLPIERCPPPSTCTRRPARPTTYQSATVTRRGRISRQGLPEHRDALMGIAWGLSPNSDAFAPATPVVSADSQPFHTSKHDMWRNAGADRRARAGRCSWPAN
jgi:hypothetical protein